MEGVLDQDEDRTHSMVALDAYFGGDSEIAEPPVEKREGHEARSVIMKDEHAPRCFQRSTGRLGAHLRGPAAALLRTERDCTLPSGTTLQSP